MVAKSAVSQTGLQLQHIPCMYVNVYSGWKIIESGAAGENKASPPACMLQLGMDCTCSWNVECLPLKLGDAWHNYFVVLNF